MKQAIDIEMFDMASELLDSMYSPINRVASCLRTANNEYYISVNSDHFSGFVCAETAVLSKALNDCHRHFDSIVTVTKDPQDRFIRVNMCGKCRQIFHDYATGIMVETSGGFMVPIEDLLPYPFTRQKDKILESWYGA